MEQFECQTKKYRVTPHTPTPKIKHSYEIFLKLKWYKVKNQLPLVYMENFIIPRPQIQHMCNVFTSFTTIKMLNSIQCNILMNPLRLS